MLAAPLPLVKLNGKLLSNTRVCFQSGCLNFNERLRENQSIMHLAIQWHVYTLLTMHDVLSSSFVRSIYLPVGNVETQWLYGPVHAGFAMQVQCSNELLCEHLIFVTVYNRASLPILSSISIRATDQTLASCSEDGFFAIRLVRKDGASTTADTKSKVFVWLKRAAAA